MLKEFKRDEVSQRNFEAIATVLERATNALDRSKELKGIRRIEISRRRKHAEYAMHVLIPSCSGPELV
jgi:hypothetical protein